MKEYGQGFHGINQITDAEEDLGKNRINGSVRSQNRCDYSHLKGRTSGLSHPGMQPT